MIISRKAQSIGEYILVLGLVSTAVIAMYTYFKRSVQATIKISVNELATQVEGLKETDYNTGMERASDFTAQWERKERLTRYRQGHRSQSRSIKDESSYWGTSNWEGETERPFWDSPKPELPNKPNPGENPLP
jgi:Flp pilus assembly pilin Flp